MLSRDIKDTKRYPKWTNNEWGKKKNALPKTYSSWDTTEEKTGEWKWRHKNHPKTIQNQREKGVWGKEKASPEKISRWY